jgi:hypothetical protein
MSFKTWLDSEIADIEGISVQLLDDILPMLKSTAAQTLTQVLPIAQSVVAGLATSGQTGVQKQAAAVAQIKSTLTTNSITAGESIINTAVELAVQNLNATPAK